MQGFTRKRGRTWTAYWSALDPSSGTRRQCSKGGSRLRKEAQAYLTEVLPLVQAGTFKKDDAS